MTQLRLADLIAFSVDPATPGARDGLHGWITDGYGNYWRNCPDCSRMEVVRQGKAQCHC